jgi:putative hydrolase of the HAD superfamily
VTAVRRDGGTSRAGERSAVVSDFGGVLTVPLLEGFARYEARSGVSAQLIGQAIARATEADGKNPLHELEVGALSEGEFLATLEREASAIADRPVELARFGEEYMAGLDPNAELFAYYRGLHERGVRLALLTNNVREWEPYWRSKLPIDEIFEVVVDSGFVGIRKPDPAIYALTLERLGLPAGACVFVDDLEHNVVAARELGFAGVHHRETADTIAAVDAALAA